MKNPLSNLGIIIAALAAVFAVLIYLEPLKNLNWGKIQHTPANVITVSGQAKSQEKNQVANFSAGIEAVNDDKQTAIDKVNQTMEKIIQAVKNFGIPQEDIKTQNMSIYQQKDSIYEDGRYVSKPGQWRVSNSISIKLKNADKATDLASLLSQSGATNVYGPNFTIEETNDIKQDLIKDAIDDARDKAQKMAQASGRKLGKVISVTEGGSSNIFTNREVYGLGAVGGGGLEPGSSTISTSVTVVFELN